LSLSIARHHPPSALLPYTTLFRSVHSVYSPDARRYLELPFVCNLISYGSNIVASVSPEYEDLVRGYISRYPAEHCFETPNLYVLDRKSTRLNSSHVSISYAVFCLK